MTDKNNPLVTVIVITYNSEKYVLETLDSIKEQTYKKIELIIADDCSEDNTIELCNKWVNANKERFVRSIIIKSKTNTGTALNLNRGIDKAQGVWIKYIAGDDALFPYTIEKYIEYINKNNNVLFLHSNIRKYRNTFDEENKFPYINSLKLTINRNGITAKEQFEILLRVNLIWAPTVMIRRDVFDKYGLFDDRYPLCEGRTMFLNLTKNNVKLEYIDLITCKYRISDKSIQKRKSAGKLFSDFDIQRHKLLYYEYLNYFPIWERFFKGLWLYRYILLDKLHLNKNNIVIKFVMSITGLPLKPIIKYYNREYHPDFQKKTPININYNIK